MRAISIPDPILMGVQRWILDRILARLPTHHNSYAYTAGTSIRQCAQKHLGARWLVKLDISDFFQSINEARVYSVFVAAGYQPLISLELARVCTRYAGHATHIDERRFVAHPHYTTVRAYIRPLLGFLPQGAPTSGALANQVARPLDIELTRLADSHGAVYTRYADDLIFSSMGTFDRGTAQDLIREARKVLQSERFTMHEQKTSVVPPGARRIVLGLLVDGDRVRISRKMRARLTGHIRGVETFGLSGHVTHSKFVSIDGFVRHVSGLLAFAHDIEPRWAAEMQNRWQAALRVNEWIDLPLFH
jgi:RNA-directed DNA polymerase